MLQWSIAKQLLLLRIWSSTIYTFVSDLGFELGFKNIYQRHTHTHRHRKPNSTRLRERVYCRSRMKWNEMKWTLTALKWFVVHEPRKKSHKYNYTYTINKQKYMKYLCWPILRVAVDAIDVPNSTKAGNSLELLIYKVMCVILFLFFFCSSATLIHFINST